MKSPGLKPPLFSREEKIGCHQEGSGCSHQTPETPAKQDPILQPWLVLLPSEGKAPQSKDWGVGGGGVKPHCIKKPHCTKGAGGKALPGQTPARASFPTSREPPAAP